MGDVNLNPADYSLDDIYTLMDLDEPTVPEITYAANAIIDQANKERNDTLVELIKALRDKAVIEIQANAEKETYAQQHEDDPRIADLWQKEYKTQPNQKQHSKITDRTQEVQMYEDENPHPVLFRNQLGVSNTYNVPVAQGTINPNLKNIVSRIVCIDSQFRQNILPYNSGNFNTPSLNTDYTLDLSDHLKNVLSIRLNSIQIPTSWYTFSKHLGNTQFQVNGLSVYIEDGYYDADSLCVALNADVSGLDFSLNKISNKIIITNKSEGGKKLTFYKPGGLGNTSMGATTYINNNLGWYLGFRREPAVSGGAIEIIIDVSGVITADAPLNLYGPRYFILAIDDFNQNHLNKGLINTIDGTTKVALPDYYTPAMPDCSCNTVKQPFPYKFPIKQMVAQNPRKLTKAQLYSVNEIILNRSVPNLRAPGPTTTNTLATIPLKGISALRNATPPEPFVETGIALQTNKREYFGPVNIERLRVRLLDDKGNIVDLNDNDWSFTMIVDQLYQY
jgi:hypothetical protein